MYWSWEKHLSKHITCCKPLLKTNVCVVQYVKKGLKGSKRPIINLERSSFRTPNNFDWWRLSRFSLIERAMKNFFLELRQLIVFVTLKLWDMTSSCEKEEARDVSKRGMGIAPRLRILRSTFAIFVRKMWSQSFRG